MNCGPGQADPHNRLAAVRRASRRCTSRASRSSTTRTHGRPRRAWRARPRALPTCLAFLGDCDGPGERQLDEFVRRGARRAARGLRALRRLRRRRATCPRWLRAHDLPVAAAYVNWIGRTRAPRARGARARARRWRRGCRAGRIAAPADAAGACAAQLVDFVAAERRQGRLRADADRADAARLVAGATSRTPSRSRCSALLALPFLLSSSPLFDLAAAPARDARPRDRARARRRPHVAALAGVRGPRHHQRSSPRSAASSPGASGAGW